MWRGEERTNVERFKKRGLCGKVLKSQLWKPDSGTT